MRERADDRAEEAERARRRVARSRNAGAMRGVVAFALKTYPTVPTRVRRIARCQCTRVVT